MNGSTVSCKNKCIFSKLQKLAYDFYIINIHAYVCPYDFDCKYMLLKNKCIHILNTEGFYKFLQCCKCIHFYAGDCTSLQYESRLIIIVHTGNASVNDDGDLDDYHER